MSFWNNFFVICQPKNKSKSTKKIQFSAHVTVHNIPANGKCKSTKKARSVSNTKKIRKDISLEYYKSLLKNDSPIKMEEVEKAIILYLEYVNNFKK